MNPNPGFVSQRCYLLNMAQKEASVRPSKKTSSVEPLFLTLEDVAAYLSVSVPQVYALVRSGELPAIKLGGRGVWRVNREKLTDYLENLEAQTLEWAKAHPLNSKDR